MAELSYLLSITGDCNNSSSGVINVIPNGGVPPYIVDFFNPSLGTGQTKTNLTSGQYEIRINDSLGGFNNEIYLIALVSSGGCLTITEINHTTCGLNNGSIIATASTISYPINYTLFSGNTTITTGATESENFGISNLSSGVYRLYYEDYGGCSGYSESIIIKPSTQLDWGFYSVNDTQCFGNVGKLQITGITGTPPYTYLWSNGQTGDTITGLTASTYSVTVTDSGGCSKTKVGTVNNAEPLTIANITASTPTCFTSDGSVTLTITGGTGPFFYSGSNGTTLITYSNVVTISGFSAGIARVVVSDATLCSTDASIYLQAPQSFSVANITTTNSTCSTNGGSVSVSVIGVPPFTYTLIYPDSSTESTTELSTNKSYSNLVNGDYTLSITNLDGCVYNHEFSIFTSDKFDVNVNVTGTTCGASNGVAYVTVGTGYTGVLDFVVSKNQTPVIQYIDVVQTANTFNNLSSGNYQIQIRDEENCSIYRDFTIQQSNALNFGLTATNCGESNNQGTIGVNIYNGTPPFTYNWSSNVSGQTGITLTGLTGGTYTLTIVDNSGCTLTRSVVVPCSPLVSGYRVSSVISTGFTIQNETERTFDTMVNEGFYDLTSGNTNCVLSSATYTAFVEVSGNTYTENFYTGSTLSDVPSNNLWVQTLESIVSGITGVSEYTINQVTNTVRLFSECNGDVNVLSDSEFLMGIIINFDIYCET